MPLRIYPLSHKSTEAARIPAYQQTLPETSLWHGTKSEQKGFAVVTVPIGFKVHGTACVSVSALTDGSCSLKGDLKVIL